MHNVFDNNLVNLVKINYTKAYSIMRQSLFRQSPERPKLLGLDIPLGMVAEGCKFPSLSIPIEGRLLTKVLPVAPK